MKKLLLRHWQLKLLFLMAWTGIAFVEGSEPADYTREPGPPWLFLSTLPMFLLAFAWAHQADIDRRGGAGALKYGRWMLAVGIDALMLFLPVVVVVSIAASIQTHSYTRRAINSELILAGFAARHEVTRAADRNGSLVGAGRCVKPPELSRTVDFAQVSSDGLVVLHSGRSESTLLFIPKMEQGKTLWQCRGFPAKAFPLMCRGEGESWTRSEPSPESDMPSQNCAK